MRGKNHNDWKTVAIYCYLVRMDKIKMPASQLIIVQTSSRNTEFSIPYCSKFSFSIKNIGVCMLGENLILKFNVFSDKQFF